MSEGAEGVKKPNSWALRAAIALAALGLLAAFIGLAPTCSRLEESGFERFAVGALSKLEVIGDEAPAQPQETFTDAAGAEVRLADFRGQVVVLNLWATWCPPCVEEMPTLAALQRAYPEGVKVLALSVDRVGDKAMAERMLADLSGGALSFYHDPSYAVAFAARARGFPTTVVYDPQGREVARLAGSADWASPEARALIEELRPG